MKKVKQKSLRQLAKELGVSASYLSQVKNGKRPPSGKLLSRPAYATLLSTNVKHLEVNRGVAQPGSAPEWGSGGRRFESGHPDHELSLKSLSLCKPFHGSTAHC